MNQTPEQFMDSLKNAGLTKDEKETLWHTLYAYAIANPRGPTHVFAFFTRHAVLYSVLALLALVGGTTVLAQQSLPGEALYQVKLNVNDQVATALAGDEDAQLDKELEQIDRITGEEALAANKELNVQSSEQNQEEQQSIIGQDDHEASSSASLDGDFQMHSSASNSDNEHQSHSGQKDNQDSQQGHGDEGQ